MDSVFDNSTAIPPGSLSSGLLLWDCPQALATFKSVTSLSQNFTPIVYLNGAQPPASEFNTRFFYHRLINEIPISGVVFDEKETIGWGVQNNFKVNGFGTAIRFVAYLTGIEVDKPMPKMPPR